MTAAVRVLRVAALSVLLLLAGAVLLPWLGHDGGQALTALAQAPTPTLGPTPPGGPSLLRHQYPPGWNLIAGSFATTDRIIYEYRTDSGTYERLPSGSQLQRGRGYWAFFAFPQVVPVIPRNGCEVGVMIPGPTPRGYCVPAQPPVPLPAGRWVLIGNPYSEGIGLVGADVVYTYDTIQGQYLQAGRGSFYNPTRDDYVEADVLGVGAGAFVYSTQGGLLTYVPIDLQPPPR